MKTSYIFLATGFEEIEAVTPIDILRRAGMNVKTVSVNPDSLKVTGAHGVTYIADIRMEQVSSSDADWLILPGGMPGASNLYGCEALRQMLHDHAAAGGNIAAICASPAVVLGQMGLLKGRRATCSPGFEQQCADAVYLPEAVVTDGNIITGRGPATATPFALAIAAASQGKEKAAEVASGMLYDLSDAD